MPSASSGASRSTRWRCSCCASSGRTRASGMCRSIFASANGDSVGLHHYRVDLISIALINLFTKQVATISGVAFTAAFFIIFTLSERINQRKLDRPWPRSINFSCSTRDDRRKRSARDRDRAGGGARLQHALAPRDVLSPINTDEQDMVVLTTRLVAGPVAASASFTMKTLLPITSRSCSRASWPWPKNREAGRIGDCAGDEHLRCGGPDGRAFGFRRNCRRQII